VFGRVVATVPNVLPGYELATSPSPEVSDDDLRRCDGDEPAEYQRTAVTLRSGIQAWVYFKA
jgi:hypothetical protein